MDDFIRAMFLLLALLNPFLMSIYLLNLIRDLSLAVFSGVLLRATLISTMVFYGFVWSGERFFTDFLQVSFSAFQIFGGVVFALIGLRFVFHGAGSIMEMRGPPEYLAGTIAMPFIIGPGTVSASILIGVRLPILTGMVAVLAAMLASMMTLIFLKLLHDIISRRNSRLVDRYVEIMGKISGLIIGTMAVEMILRGVGEWIKKVI